MNKYFIYYLCLFFIACNGDIPLEGTWTYSSGERLTFKITNKVILGDENECDYSVSKDSVITFFDAKNDSIIPMKYKIDKLTEDTLILRRKTWVKGVGKGDILVKIDN